MQKKLQLNLIPLTTEANPFVGQCINNKIANTLDRDQQTLSKDNGIYVFYQNVRGLKTKLKTWRNGISLLDHSLLAVTETFLDDSVRDGELSKGDWSILRRDRKTPCGGVLLAARTPIITLQRRQDLETDNGEDLCASFAWRGRTVFVCVIYVKPECYR
ncbi:unnamed protein product [Euphydryas editha]|uniref:Uncharacterized protein n=1 Tax=Euphydryas editha TaxID=104508 RepID=A0AAU9UH17_EUPED|nr:unnamed protein product [Euphydryas editha]